MVEKNIAGLNLTNSLCPDCGYIHPRVEGSCPMATKNKKIKTTNNTVSNNSGNKKISELLKQVNNIIEKKLSNMKFENEYSEGKFYVNLEKNILENIINFLNDYKV